MARQSSQGRTGQGPPGVSGRGLGLAGEDAAARHLEAHGLSIVARNWRCRWGELDLVATDGPQVVIVEVKARSGSGFGTPAEAVGPRKQARLARLAQAFLHARGWWDRPVRFDVVAVAADPGCGSVHVEWIQDAFRP